MTSSRFATIAHDLRERIALGEFGDTGAMDSEAQLGARYDVSRPTVRRALETLRDENLVASRHGAGWFVTGSAFHQRLAIGTFRHATSAVVEAGKSIERRVVEFGFRAAPHSLAVALGVDEGSDLLHARSVRTVEGEGLDVVREWVPAPLAGSLSRDAATTPGIWESLTRQGHRITTVRQTVTAGLASTPDADLLGVAQGDPLLLVRRVAVGAGGQPVALSDHRYLAARFALEVEFNSGPATAASETPGLRSVARSSPPP
ncbi:MAG: GntR family transcriptional regulator [Actinomycetota bacterium]|nr:GntR family transcriptional regulator [Actinomycetota bacterium]